MFSKCKLVLAAASAVLLLTSAAWADYAVLQSGHRLKITAHETRGETVRLYLASGGYADVPTSLVTGYEIEEIILAATGAVEEEFQRQLITEAAARHGLSPVLVASVVAVESNFNPRAVSAKGALGLMQLMPETASRFAVRDAFDPAENVDAGVRYLKELLQRFGNDLRLALAAYNAGPERVALYGGIPPYPETRAYVQKVITQARRAQLHLRTQ